MFLSKKIIAFAVPFGMVFQLAAMNPAGPVRVDAGKQERVRRVNVEIEQKSKIAGLGIATVSAIGSTPWLSKLLRRKTLIVVGIAVIGLIIYKLGEKTDYWGLRPFLRHHSRAWLELQGQQGPAAVSHGTYEDFIKAIDQHQIETVRRLVQDHKDWVNQRDKNEALPLTHALSLYTPAAAGYPARGDQQAQLAIVGILLNAGAQWNQLLRAESVLNHETGLDAVVRMKDVELLRLFCQAGARLHNVSEGYRHYVHALNAEARDGANEQRLKQQILHLFAQAGAQETACPICRENLNETKADGNFARNLGIYLCGHLYCQDCYNDMTKRHEICGVCRQPPYNGAQKQHRFWIDERDLQQQQHQHQ